MIAAPDASVIEQFKEGSADKGLLEQMVRLQADTPERQEEMARFLADHFRRLCIGNVSLQEVTGKYATGLEKRHNVVIDVEGSGSTDETLMFYAHFDVVPPHEGYADIASTRRPNEVFTEPKARQKGAILKGLGVEDMLGGIAAIERAIREIVKKNLLWAHRNIRILLTYGEEGYSTGFAGARDGGLFEGIDAVATPEILVNKRLLALSDHVRAQIIGRLGLATFRVTCRGRSMHAGCVNADEEEQLTENLDIQARLALKEIGLNPYQNAPDGVTLAPPTMHRTKWSSNGAIDEPGVAKDDALSVPSSSSFDVAAHYADHRQTPGDIFSAVRAKLDAVAEQLFSGSGKEARHMREQAFTVTPAEHPVGFSVPSMENPHNPFVMNMREIMAHAYTACSKAKKKRAKTEDLIALLCDGGTADCPRIQHLGIPLVGNPVVGGGAHTPHEWLDWRSVDEVALSYVLAAMNPNIIAPKEW